MSNRYNSITETMKAPILATSQAFSNYGTPGATASVQIGDFITPCYLLGTSGVSGGLYDFVGSDIPSIKSFQIVSPLGDGLASQPSSSQAMSFTLQWISFDSGHNAVGTPMVNIPLYAEIFNSPEESELFKLFTTPAAMATLAANNALGGVTTRLALAFPAQWNFAAYSMAAGWSAAFFDVWIHMVVEHTYSLT